MERKSSSFEVEPSASGANGSVDGVVARWLRVVGVDEPPTELAPTPWDALPDLSRPANAAPLPRTYALVILPGRGRASLVTSMADVIESRLVGRDPFTVFKDDQLEVSFQVTSPDDELADVERFACGLAELVPNDGQVPTVQFIDLDSQNSGKSFT